MTRDRDVELLAGVALFQGLDDEALGLLAFAAERLAFCAGEAIARRGESAEAAYVIISGRVKQPGVHGFGEEDVFLGPGDMLGELAMMSHGVSERTYIALEETIVMEFTRDALHALMRRHPEIGLHLSAQLARRLHELAQSMRMAEQRRLRRRQIEWQMQHPPRLGILARLRAAGLMSTQTRTGYSTIR